MAKKLLVLAVALPLAAAGAYFGGEYLLAKSAQAVLDKVQASLPQGATLKHGALHTNLLRREVVLDGFDVTVPSGPSQSLSATRLRLSGLPWFSGSTFEIGQMTIEGVTAIHHGTIKADSWVVDQPGVQIINQLATGQVASNQFSFAGARITNLTISRSQPQINVQVASVSAGALANNRISHLELEGIAATSQDVRGPLVHLKVANISADDLDIGRIVSDKGEIDLTAPILSNSLSALVLNKLSLGPDDGEPITLEALNLKGEGRPDGTRTALDLKAQEFNVPLAAMPAESRQYYRELGYQRLSMNIGLTGNYNPDAHMLAVQQFNLVALEAGSVNLSFELGGVSDPGTFSHDSMSAQMLLSTITLNGLDLKLTDSGFIQRYVARGAKELVVTPDVYIEQMVNSIRPITQGGGQGEQKLGTLYRAVSGFLLHPGELVIGLHPEKPVALLQLMFSLNNPAGAAETLGVSASNRQLPRSEATP